MESSGGVALGETTLASTLADFLRKHPPLQNLGQLAQPPIGQQLVHVRRRLSRTDDQRPATTVLQRQRHGASAIEFKSRVVQASKCLRASMLFRLVGACLQTSVYFGLNLLVVVPLISQFLLSRRIANFFWISAFSTVGHFALMPLFNASFLTHDKGQRGTQLQTFKKIVTSPLGLCALLMQARLYAAFVTTLLVLSGIKRHHLWDQVLAACLGVTLLIRSVLGDDHLTLRWSAHGLPKSSRWRTLSTSFSTYSIHFLVVGVLLRIIHSFNGRRNFPILRLLINFMLAPWPTLGVSEYLQKGDMASDRAVLLSSTHVLTLFAGCALLHIWILATYQAYQSVTKSNVIGDHTQLLIMMNSRLLVDQHAVFNHIRGACRGVPRFLPLASAVVFLPSDSPHLFNSPHLSSRTAYHVPLQSVLRVPTYSNPSSSNPLPISTTKRDDFLFHLKEFPFRVLKLALAPLLRNLPSEWSSAIHVTLSQAAAKVWWSRPLCWVFDPQSFGGSLPCDFSEEQISILCGAQCPGFYSVFPSNGHLVLSAEAGELIFGDQLFPAFSARLTSLATSLTKLIDTVEVLLTTPISGLAVKKGSNTFNSARSPPVRYQDAKRAVYRYELQFYNHLEEALTILLGEALLSARGHTPLTSPFIEALRPFRLPVTDQGAEEASHWLQFGDKTVGLVSARRNELLQYCQVALGANIGLVHIGLEAMLEITRVRCHVFACRSPMSGAAQSPTAVKSVASPFGSSTERLPAFFGGSGELVDKLRKHFPSLRQESRSGAHSSDSLSNLLTFVSRLYPAIADFVALPSNPPLSIRNEALVETANDLLQYLPTWLRTFSSLLQVDINALLKANNQSRTSEENRNI